MKKIILFLMICFGINLSYSQANIENDDNFPTGYISATNPYYYGSIDGVLYVFSGRNPYVLVRFPQGDPRESFEIPATVARIARGAFKGCMNLKELIIPESVYLIGDNAFDDSEIMSFIVSGNNLSVGSTFDTNRDDPKYFGLSGIQTSEPISGINIEVSNGKSKKILVK